MMAQEKSKIMVKCLDEVDRQIVALLQRDGRTSNVEIARELGLAEGTVRKRYERLVARCIIRVAAVVDPARVECGARTIIGIEVDLAQVEKVAARLAGLPEVYAVSLVTGAYDLVVEVVLPSSDQLLSFLMDKLAVIPGVKRTETCHVLKVVKRPSDWTVPERDAGAAEARSEPNGTPQGGPRGVGPQPPRPSSQEILPGTIVIPS
jgi:Lrp/AsnC family transcriptional regulator for asnA, asnC and gidA